MYYVYIYNVVLCITYTYIMLYYVLRIHIQCCIMYYVYIYNVVLCITYTYIMMYFLCYDPVQCVLCHEGI